jgi:hypothetical protein
MIVWWVFLGGCVLVFTAYDAIVNGSQKKGTGTMGQRHFNGWRLEQSDKKTCTTKGYPGYPNCPPQQYFVDGKPQ